MLEVLENICEHAEHDKFTHAICDALGLDWLEASSHEIAEELSSRVMQEIHKRYQLCPLDRHGETIHTGDCLETIGRVQAIGEDIVCAGDLIYSDEPPCYSGYAIFSSEAYAKTSPYREVLRSFAEFLGVEASPFALSEFESRLKAVK